MYTSVLCEKQTGALPDSENDLQQPVPGAGDFVRHVCVKSAEFFVDVSGASVLFHGGLFYRDFPKK